MGFHVWVLAPSEHVVASVLSWAKGACCGGCDSIAFDLPSAGGLIGECEPPSEHPTAIITEFQTRLKQALTRFLLYTLAKRVIGRKVESKGVKVPPVIPY